MEEYTKELDGDWEEIEFKGDFFVHRDTANYRIYYLRDFKDMRDLHTYLTVFFASNSWFSWNNERLTIRRTDSHGALIHCAVSNDNLAEAVQGGHMYCSQEMKPDDIPPHLLARVSNLQDSDVAYLLSHPPQK